MGDFAVSLRYEKKKQQHLSNKIETTKSQNIRRQQMIQELKQMLTKMIFESGAFVMRATLFKHHDKYPDAPIPPNYLNMRTKDNLKPGPLTDDDCELIARCMWQVVLDLNLLFSAITGVPYAGVPLVKALERFLAWPWGFRAIPLAKEETENSRRIIPAPGFQYRPGGIILPWDNVISWGETSKETVLSLRKSGLIVNDYLVTIDREEGGKEMLAEIDCRVLCFMTMTELLEISLSMGYLTMKEFEKSLQYMQLSREFRGGMK